MMKLNEHISEKDAQRIMSVSRHTIPKRRPDFDVQEWGGRFWYRIDTFEKSASSAGYSYSETAFRRAVVQARSYDYDTAEWVTLAEVLRFFPRTRQNFFQTYQDTVAQFSVPYGEKKFLVFNKGSVKQVLTNPKFVKRLKFPRNAGYGSVRWHSKEQWLQEVAEW